jgi:hypothetical protein
MDKPTGVRVGRIALAWVVFLGGLGLLLGLHTFRDRLAHQAIGPLFLLLWVFLLVSGWDGCRGLKLRWRCALFTVQVAVSVVLCLCLFQYLIRLSI